MLYPKDLFCCQFKFSCAAASPQLLDGRLLLKAYHLPPVTSSGESSLALLLLLNVGDYQSSHYVLHVVSHYCQRISLSALHNIQKACKQRLSLHYC